MFFTQWNIDSWQYVPCEEGVSLATRGSLLDLLGEFLLLTVAEFPGSKFPRDTFIFQDLTHVLLLMPPWGPFASRPEAGTFLGVKSRSWEQQKEKDKKTQSVHATLSLCHILAFPLPISSSPFSSRSVSLFPSCH